MTIILNENAWVENVLKEKSLGRKPFETLCRIAKYYLSMGYSKSKTKSFLESFVSVCDPYGSMAAWRSFIDSAIKSVTKYPITTVNSISLSSSELETVKKIKGKQIQRLAFVLLCVAKYWDTVSPSNNHWVNLQDNEIMKMANINTSTKRQCLMYSQLKELGLIQFAAQVDNLNTRVLFIDNYDDSIEISDFRNLGYQYLKYLGEDYFECENCGIVTKRNSPERGRKQKYCADCAAAIKIKQSVNHTMMVFTQL